MIKPIARWILRHEIYTTEMLLNAMMIGLREHGLCLQLPKKDSVTLEEIKVVTIEEMEADE